jgi:hypothetical protein
MMKKIFTGVFVFFAAAILSACVQQFGPMGFIGSPILSEPEEYRHVYEAKEKIVLTAIAAVLEEKKIGKNVSIDFANRRVDSDYVVSDNWRTKTTAHVRQLNWKESEVRLTVLTELQTKDGWQLRRLLKKEQYDSFFYTIELKIYDEMARVQ